MKRFTCSLVSALLLVCSSRAIGLPAALDAETLTWTTGGDVAWFGQADVAYDGEDAAQGGGLGQGQQSWLETTVTGPCTVGFQWMCQSEGVDGSFRLCVDDVERAAASEIWYTGWEQRRVALPAGTHTLRWEWRTSSVWWDGWYNECYVDQVTVGLPMITVQPTDVVLGSGETAALAVAAAGKALLAYQWYEGESGDTAGLIPGATNATYVTPPATVDASYWVSVSNEKGDDTSRTAHVRIGFAVYTLADLQKVGSGADGWTMDAAYRLMADIDASATAGWNDAETDESLCEGFFPIGDDEGALGPFLGLFDGRGHVIRALTVNRPWQADAGLFGLVAGGGIQNLGLVGGRVTGDWWVGGLVGRNDGGRIARCYAAGTATGNWTVGGLVGYSSGEVVQSYADGRVTGDEETGGLVGANEGIVAGCYAAGAVPVGNGLIGANWDGTAADSYWDVEASGQEGSAGGEGRTAAQMRQQGAFPGWDFEGTWGIQEGVGSPYLRLFAEGRTDHAAGASTVCPANLSFLWTLRPAMTAAVSAAGCDYLTARWQIATAADFSDARDWTGLADDGDVLRSPFSSRVPVALALEYGTFYYWRVRLQAGYGVWGDWSQPALFLAWEPFDKVAAGKQELGVWADGAMAALWRPDYLFGAHDAFRAAVQADGTNCEARVCRSLTTLMMLAENQGLRDLLAAFGYTFDASLFTFTGRFAAAASPLPNATVDRLAAQVLPAIDAALADLTAVPTNWTGTVEIAPADFPVDAPVWLDLGDVLYARATLGAARALLETAQAYDLTLDYTKTNLFLPDPVAPALEVTLDGDEREWTNVPAALFGGRCQLEYAKIARSAGQVHVLARLAEGIEASSFWVEVGSVSNSLGAYFEGIEEGQTYQDWAATLTYQGSVLEASLDLPPAEQGEARHLGEIWINYQNPLPAEAPTRAVTADGDASEWSGAPVALSGAGELIDTVTIARWEDEVHVLVTFKGGWSFDDLYYVGGNLRTYSGGVFTIGTPDAAYAFGPAALEISCPLPTELAGEGFYLEDFYVEVATADLDVRAESVWFELSGYDGAAYSPRRAPLNRILADQPACLNAVRDAGKLAVARLSLAEALALALAADAAITGRTDGVMHFIEYDPVQTNAQAELRRRLQEARSSLDAPQAVAYGGREASLCLGAVFEAPHVTRALLPRLTDDDELVCGTFPDPTFHGMLPEMTQAAWREALLGAVPLVVENAFAMDGQTFNTGGYALWGVVPDAGGRTNVAQSGVLSNAHSTWVETTFTGPGTVDFSWAVSSRDKWDFLCVYVDGVRQCGSISGAADWRPRQIALPSGSHRVRWAFVKNDAAAAGADAGGLDSLSWRACSVASTSTPVPVPYAWLDGFSGLVQGGDYNAAAWADQDHDGRCTWEEYVAGTGPTNAASAFLATIMSGGPGLVVGWTPDLGPARVYTVEGKPALDAPEWAPTNGASRYFRVKVWLP